MVPELTASGAALAWGAADFCGGKASRRADARAVVVVAHAFSIPLLALSLVIAGGDGPVAADLIWGFLAGLCGGVALVLLYGALAAGSMSVVAPVTAVTAAVLPLGVGLVIDPTPTPLELAGVGIAIVAIGLVSAAPGGSAVSSRVLALSVAAGAGLGLFYALLEPIRTDAGLWPLVGIRAATLLVGLAMLAQARIPPRLDRGSSLWAVGAGTLDWAANALYLLAAYTGVLYPVGTVLLAVAVDRERPRPVRVMGLGLAGVALVLARAG
jgi:drug/metabolite transporter (DMT)-like permease